jgi:hypothetical protein
MGQWLFLAFVTAFGSAVSTRFLLAALIEGPLYNGGREYKVLALKVSRGYRIFAWSVIALGLLGALIQLFWRAAADFLI